MRPARIATVAATALALAAVLSGCATYSARLGAVRPQLQSGDSDTALATIEDAKSGKDLLLYYLEKGLVLHYAGRWAESNDVLEAAEDLAADLYTKSISEGVLSLVTSDNTISYRAQPFEMAMIPYYRALNYVSLGLREDALVEARKAGYLLREYADPTADEEEAAALEDSAFLHWFAGMLYEWDREWNDAFIEYRLAAEAYGRRGGLALQTPPWLGGDIRRTARLAGLDDLLAELEKNRPGLFDGGGAGGPDGRHGEVVVMVECGYVAHKIQRDLSVPILENDADADYDDFDDWALALSYRTRPGWTAGKADIAYWLRIAMPEMVAGRPGVVGARVSAGGAHAGTVNAEDLSGRALKTFEGRQGTILLKTLARALAKWAAQQEAKKKGEVAGLLANLFGVATESADTRSWLTLPRSVGVARLTLPAGVHDLRIELVDDRGAVVETEEIPAVEVAAGDWVFLSRRVF